MLVDVKQTIFVAGHCGMLGTAIVRSLQSLGYQSILTATRDEVNLTRQARLRLFLLNTALIKCI